MTHGFDFGCAEAKQVAISLTAELSTSCFQTWSHTGELTHDTRIVGVALCPIFKAGDRHDMDNWYGIAVSSVLSKVYATVPETL